MEEAVTEIGIDSSSEKYLVFTAGGKRYALPSKTVGEVAVLDKIFPLPLVPDYLRGIINRYSVPYALIDICSLFHGEKSNAGKVIVLKEEMDKLAILIDDVTDIADLKPEQIMSAEFEENAVSCAVNAFFEWNGSHVLCLDPECLLDWIKKDFENN